MNIEIKCNYSNLVDIEELVPAPNNPNKHTKSQIERLAKLIEHYGFRKPIIVSNLSGHIVTGHGTLEAAKLLGMNQVPVSFQQYKDQDEEWGHMVADNSIGQWSGMDMAKINEDFVDLDPSFDLELLGFEKDFAIEPMDFELGGEDKEAPIKVVVKPGQVWDLDGHIFSVGKNNLENAQKIIDSKFVANKQLKDITDALIIAQPGKDIKQVCREVLNKLEPLKEQSLWRRMLEKIRKFFKNK